MWNQAIVRELAVVLIIKLAALTLIWLAFFNDPNERELSSHEVGELLLGSPRNAITPNLNSINSQETGDGY